MTTIIATQSGIYLGQTEDGLAAYTYNHDGGEFAPREYRIHDGAEDRKPARRNLRADMILRARADRAYVQTLLGNI